MDNSTCALDTCANESGSQTFCSLHTTCACGRPMAHNGTCRVRLYNKVYAQVVRWYASRTALTEALLTDAHLIAARKVARICGKCDGTGIWWQKGPLVNGYQTLSAKQCYACRGKGAQTLADRRRNWGYHMFHARAEA